MGFLWRCCLCITQCCRPKLPITLMGFTSQQLSPQILYIVSNIPVGQIPIKAVNPGV